MNFFIDLTMALLKTITDLMSFGFALVLVYLVLNFILKLLKKEEFRKVNVEAYQDWVAVTKNTANKKMAHLWTVGTKRISESRIDKIVGYSQAYLPEPQRDEYARGNAGLKMFKTALDQHKNEKKEGLDTLHIFALRPWWNPLAKTLLYVIPDNILVDDILVGDIFVNCAGFLPCLHYWRLPSNINRKRYVDAIKTNSIYLAYEQDWDYIGNIAQKAVEAENQFLKAKGIKESILGIFGKKEQGDKR